MGNILADQRKSREIEVDHKGSSTQTNNKKSENDSVVVSVDNRVQLSFEKDTEEIILEPLEQHPYEVSYTCLLLPKLSSHYLIGDIADRLDAMLKNICTSNGWRLEFLSIKPDYLQWAISVPPSTSTTHVIHIVRKQTSLQIFSEFPRFKRENQSDDFWAPGYLIFWGSQPHPVEVIQRYIRQTRRQQGILMDE